jgi:hypothetical protein
VTGGPPTPDGRRPPEVTVGLLALAVGGVVGLLTVVVAPVGWAVIAGLATALVLGAFFRMLLRAR